MMKMMVGAGAATLALACGSGIASAQPNVDAIVYSTCSYSQVMAALNAQDPVVAESISANAMASAWLQQLVAAPPDKRRTMVAQVQGYPQVQSYTALINQVATSCQNY